ncbi:hypothetical protein EBI00_11850 [Marinomonas hwangdonensis]|uniref:Uncharacterized protein n=1 Tax=Marinomonas hwangdonensis TaxID=1053647 RepID=A0A3M8Q0K7_9GAMM|nr:hypothetical protein [Marinomonas hwangdonensis]RNF49623.1 hypothetical protein EBI00_11850 [Marinomonas hwangdonensis]
MSPKILFSAALIGLTSFFVSTNAFAFEDYCTPKLNTYLESVQKTVDSKYVAQRQKDVAQKILDRVKNSRNDTEDCVLLSKLLP